MRPQPPKKIYGLIGYPVKHSLSPAMHNAAFKALNIEAEYRLFEVRPENLEGFLLEDSEVKDVDGRSVWTADIFGFNITIPHKIRAKETLEEKFPLGSNADRDLREDLYYVKLSGAINTVKKSDGKLEYRNTDAHGFLRSLEGAGKGDLNFKPQNKKALVIGCGGAGRAIIAALSWVNSGVKEIFISDISPEALRSAQQHFFTLGQPDLEKNLRFIKAEEMQKHIQDCQLLVNASPVGMKETDNSVIDKRLLHKNLSVYDVVYNRETQLIKDAKSVGLSAVDGSNMLLYQGAAAFEFWTGKKAPVEAMREALSKALEES